MTFQQLMMSFHPSWNVFMAYMEEENFLPEWIQTSEPATYKCSWGRECVDPSCGYIHPGQYGYRYAPYYESKTKCYYETETSACRLKCGQSNGRYCPFLHCSHTSMEHLSIQCPRPDCQRHCPHCI